jgi:outer membrane lipoprotein SlyB
MRAATILTIPLALLLPLGGCAESPNSVSSAEANTVQSVYFGTITALQGVDIRPGQTRIGAITGAIIGGAAGSTLGSSTAANVAGAAAGATVGGAAGSAVQGADRRNGIDFTIRLDNGDTVSVVQQGNVNDWRVGDRVRVTGSAGNARVTR